jgi:hypothetical protein
LEIPLDNHIPHVPRCVMREAFDWKHSRIYMLVAEAIPQSCIPCPDLFLVESCDLCPSSQYILVRVIPSCFHFAKNVFVPSKSLANVHPEILDIFFMGELHIVYMDPGGGGAHFSSCGECDVDRFGSVSFYSPCFKPVLDCS